MKRVAETRALITSDAGKFLFISAIAICVLGTSLTLRARAGMKPAETALPQTVSVMTMTTRPDARTATPKVFVATPAPTGFLKQLSACPGLSTARAADVDPDLTVRDFKPFVEAAGSVRLATAPVGGGCYSSAFGMRNGRLHKGVDYYSNEAVPVYAAAAGRVRTRAFRGDYGNMIVIEHGNGVYTRYAHLESFAGPDVGDLVNPGDVLGIMGNSATSTIPRHLHYEVLTGTWQLRLGSFALTPVDVMTLPVAE